MIDLRLGVASGRVDAVPADLAIVGIFADERPLRGASGQVDWRLCGGLSRLIRSGRIGGGRGEAALLPGGGGVRAGQVLVLGLGARAAFDGVRWADRLLDALGRALGLRAQRVVLALPGPVSPSVAVEEQAAVLLEVSTEALADLAIGQTRVEIRWVVAPELRLGAVEALDRAIRARPEGGVRLRPTDGSPEQAAPDASPAPSPRVETGPRVK